MTAELLEKCRKAAVYRRTYDQRHPENRKRFNHSYYERHKVRLNARRTERYRAADAAVKERKAAWWRKYEAINGDRIKAQQKEYRELNKESRAGSNRRWRLNNREWIRNYLTTNSHVSIQASAKRRALKRGSLVDERLIKEWMLRIKSSPAFRCYYCDRLISTLDVHFDHVLPLSKQYPHRIENICASCPSCNLSKGSKLISEWIKKGQQILCL